MTKQRSRGSTAVARSHLLSKDENFWEFLGVSNAEDAAEEIYERCSIESRGELARNRYAQDEFRTLDREFMQWQNPIDNQYAENLSRDY